MEEMVKYGAKRQLSPDQWDMILAMAPVMHASRFFGVQSKEQAAAIMAKGYSVGLDPVTSFEFIVVIQNKPALIPRGALALIQNSPRFVDMNIDDIADKQGKPERCRVWMKRDNGHEYTAEFSMDDAKRASLIKSGGGWEKYPANMLRWRAVGFCADVVFPDVLGGLKRADELGADLSPAGEVIEGEVIDSAATELPQQAPQPRIEEQPEAGSTGNGYAGTLASADGLPEGAPYESISIMPPEQCIEYLRGESAKLKEKYNSQEPTTNQFKLFTGMLSLLAGGDDTCRITWCREVFGIKESTQELKRRNIEAALNYLAPEKGDDGKYHITNDNAQEEFNLIVNAAIQRESVGELPGMEGDDEG